MKATTLGLLVLLGAGPSLAAAVTECPDNHHRQLRGNTFLFPILQQSAFVTTHVGIREGLARYDVPDLPIGRLGRRDVLLTGFQSTLDLGLGITDWLGVEGFARGTAIAGSDTQSVIVSGVSINLAGEAGAVVRLWHNDEGGSQLSVRASLGYEKDHDISVLPFVNNIVNNPLLTLEDVVLGNVGKHIFIPSSETTVKGGAHFAQALSRGLSFQLSASLQYAWRTREPFDPTVGTRIDLDSHAVRINLAGALAVDFGPVGVPVALMGEYLFTAGEETQVILPDRTLNSSTFALGLYYTGRTNLQLGVGAVATINGNPRFGLGEAGETLESGDSTLTYGQFILRYIF
ncbi:hypothetical protein P2318_31050 [Myxococcaceae bacterium GXIMD 01537]